MAINENFNKSFDKFKLSRRSRLQTVDDQRLIMVLPRDVPERTWSEILRKEENDLIIFDIREELIEEATKIVYDKYLEKQTTLFTAHCAAQAWLKIIDWHFYRHDPGEDPTSYPPCYIPKRVESWIPDPIPDPSPKDTWGKQELLVLEDASEEGVKTWPSSSSINVPVIEEIPEEYWFPGKVQMPTEEADEKLQRTVSYDSQPSGFWVGSEESELTSRASSDPLIADSEVLQKITDYGTELSPKGSHRSGPKLTTPVEASLQGAGDSTLRSGIRGKRKSKSFSRQSIAGRSRYLLAPLTDSRSRISAISDCRLRNLRLETQFEISSEIVESLQGEAGKRK